MGPPGPPVNGPLPAIAPLWQTGHMRSSLVIPAALATAALSTAGCRGEDEALASDMCRQARALERADQLAGLRLQRRVWEEAPTTGTSAAEECGRSIRARMGRVRALVSHDQRGSPAAVEGCAWTADVVEAFSGAASRPYRKAWASRLLERCVAVVGRAWTRDPDSARLSHLGGRLERMVAEGD